MGDSCARARLRKTASWLVPTHYRRDLLEECLTRLLRQEGVPGGWHVEIIVAHSADDPLAIPRQHRPIQALMRVRSVITRSSRVGGRLTEALRASRGDLVLVTADDDMQSPHRTRLAIEAFEEGWLMSGMRRFRFEDWTTGRTARWVGDPLRAGSTMNYAADILHAVGGWPDEPRNVDGSLRERLRRHLGRLRVKDLSAALYDTTVFYHHDANISLTRPFPRPGKTVKFGWFRITGERWPRAGGHSTP